MLSLSRTFIQMGVPNWISIPVLAQIQAPSIRNSEMKNWVGVLYVIRQNLVAGFENLFKALGAFMLNIHNLELLDPGSILQRYLNNCIIHYYWAMWLICEEESLSPSKPSLTGRKNFCIKHSETLQDDGYGIHVKWECLGLVED